MAAPTEAPPGYTTVLAPTPADWEQPSFEAYVRSMWEAPSPDAYAVLELLYSEPGRWARYTVETHGSALFRQIRRAVRFSWPFDEWALPQVRGEIHVRCNAEQLNRSRSWFESEYGQGAQA